MRFFTTCATALSLLTSFASAVDSQENPIIFPGTNSTLTAGSTYEITWKPTTPGTAINLALRYGPQRNLIASSVLAVGVENDGSATWVIPTGIGNGQWTIQIVDSSGNVNYSPLFAITGGTGKQGAASITSTIIASTATYTPSITNALTFPTGSGKSTTTTGAAAGQLSKHGVKAAVVGLGGALVALA